MFWNLKFKNVSEKGEYDFRASILPTPYERTTPETGKEPSISKDEKLLWQSVVNLYSLNNECTYVLGCH